MSAIKGLEVLFAVCQRDLKTKGDCIVAALHCILTNTGLSCVGIGETFSDNDSDCITELLPENWNENQEVYCIRYLSKDLKNRYLLKIARAGGNLHVNLVLNEDKSSGMTINTDDYISDDFTKFSQTYKNLDNLNNVFQQDILKNIPMDKNTNTSYTSSRSKKKSPTEKKPDPVSVKVPIPQVNPTPVGVPDRRPHGSIPSHAFPTIGGNDLDPFGRRQGSMHFDPLRTGGSSVGPFGGGRIGSIGDDRMGLPPHALPPGARFDPFSPIAPNRFNPDPDHFRPPDYDDMFM